MAVRDLLGGGFVVVRRMRAFAVANEMGREFVWYVFMPWDPDEDDWAFGLLCAQCEGSALVL